MAPEINKKRIEIADYTDYVPYISDLVDQKRKDGGFSYRIFCRKSGFHSPTYLKWVMDGVRPISPRSAGKFAIGLSLDKQEVQYFTFMVNYKEADDSESKRFYYEQMLAMRQRRAGSVVKDAYEYLSHWYFVAIRELVGASDFQDDPRWIRERLGSDLTLWEIKNGLDTLERLNLIIRDSEGHWKQTDHDLMTDHEVQSIAAYNYHHEMLELAQRVLSTTSPETRDYQSIVALVDHQTLEQFKSRIQEFQKGVIEYLQERERAQGRTPLSQELFVLNLQLFPVVARKKEDV